MVLQTPARRLAASSLMTITRTARLAAPPRAAAPAPTMLRARYSSEAPPPLLQKLKADLKTAMKAKDAPRLAVLRSILSATLNASKTATPITTDVQLVALLRKTARASQEAVAEFAGAGRQDLVDKEQAQIRVLEEYAAGSGVEDVGGDQLQAVVEGVASTLPGKKMGDVMKALLAPGGPLEGKSVEKAELARVVKEVVGQ